MTAPLLPPSPITSVVGGEPWALYRDHYPQIYRYVRRRVATDEIAEDLAADVFLRAFVSAGSYRDLRGTPAPWLYRIAAHRVADHYRRVRPILALESLWQPLQTGADPADEVALSDSVSGVWRAARALPPNQRRALWLYYGAELDMGEVAAAMHKTREAAKLLLFRARRGVRLSLGSEAGSICPGPSKVAAVTDPLLLVPTMPA